MGREWLPWPENCMAPPVVNDRKFVAPTTNHHHDQGTGPCDRQDEIGAWTSDGIRSSERPITIPSKASSHHRSSVNPRWFDPSVGVMVDGGAPKAILVILWWSSPAEKYGRFHDSLAITAFGSSTTIITNQQWPTTTNINNH